jgi:hypothetical protein
MCVLRAVALDYLLGIVNWGADPLNLARVPGETVNPGRRL